MLTTVVLDVNETLTDLAPLRRRFLDVGAEPELSATWFATVLKDALALTVAGGTAPFADFARAALLTLLREGDGADHVLEGLSQLPLHADVPDGLRALHAAGLTLVTLTNGAAAQTDAMLHREGLRELVTHVLSVDDAGAWKPSAQAYAHATRVTGAAPRETLLAAVHPWDTHGAQQVGWQGAWVNRNGAPWPQPFQAPSHQVADLVELAALLRAADPRLGVSLG